MMIFAKYPIATGFTACRWILIRSFVAIILIAAAGLKVYQLATVPVLGEGLLNARWFNILVVEFEIFFGFGLIAGLLPKLTWLASTVLFSAFTMVSLFKAVTGEVSCGCFGSVAVNPWITTIFDVSVIGLLGISRPRGNFLCWVPSRQLLLYCGFCVLTGIVVYSWISQMTFERLEQVGQVLEGNIIQLEPEKWIGKEFPLRDYVVGEQDFMQRNWMILLVRPGCEYCDGAKTRLFQNAKENKYSVVFLDVASATSQLTVNENIRNVRLISDVVWVVETPVILELQDGIVQNVKLRKQMLSKTTDSY